MGRRKIVWEAEYRGKIRPINEIIECLVSDASMRIEKQEVLIGKIQQMFECTREPAWRRLKEEVERNPKLEREEKFGVMWVSRKERKVVARRIQPPVDISGGRVDKKEEFDGKKFLKDLNEFFEK